MKKSITITETKGGHEMKVIGYDNFEVMGILRFHEKRIWVNSFEKNEVKNQTKKEVK